MRSEAERRGFHLARRRVTIGDGARRIWNVAAEMFPGAVQIADCFHASERLWVPTSAAASTRAKRTTDSELNRARMRYQ